MSGILASILDRLLHTRIGAWCVNLGILATQYRVFSPRTTHALKLDALRLRARMRQRRRRGEIPPSTKLHMGCGKRKIPGWLNVDLIDSDDDVDLAAGQLPWADGVFEVVASQQVIEHLDLASELVPLFRELRRVCKPGAEIWMACPDLAKACQAYQEDRGAALLADRDARCSGDSEIGSIPKQHYINMLFQQFGEHKNLLDLELIDWLCRMTGFGDCRRVSEQEFLQRFPEFPHRNDDFTSIYVRALAMPVPASDSGCEDAEDLSACARQPLEVS